MTESEIAPVNVNAEYIVFVDNRFRRLFEAFVCELMISELFISRYPSFRCPFIASCCQREEKFSTRGGKIFETTSGKGTNTVGEESITVYFEVRNDAERVEPADAAFGLTRDI